MSLIIYGINERLILENEPVPFAPWIYYNYPDNTNAFLMNYLRLSDYQL